MFFLLYYRNRPQIFTFKTLITLATFHCSLNVNLIFAHYSPNIKRTFIHCLDFGFLANILHCSPSVQEPPTNHRRKLTFLNIWMLANTQRTIAHCSLANIYRTFGSYLFNVNIRIEHLANIRRVFSRESPHENYKFEQWTYFRWMLGE